MAPPSSSDSKVQLYLYDLSNGMAASMSLQLTGKHIPAVWHSSIIVYGEEIYFGQGIQRCRPGMSHHGRPLRVVDLGTTGLDRETFHDYLSSLQEVYTSDKYHLLDFNCNTFTNDVSNFLTGTSIPQDVIDLPKEFLSTPFGASLRPYIDNLFRGQMQGTGQPQRQQPQMPPQLAQSIAGNPALSAGLQQVIEAAQRAQQPASTSANGYHSQASEPLASSLTVATNLSSFDNLLATNKAAAVMFTGEWCGPCKAIKPLFEDLAKRSPQDPPTAFVLVDTTAGREVAQRYNISAVPTFMFFHKKQKVSEMKGADAGELRAQIGMLAMTAYPPHAHTKLKLPALKFMSNAAVTYEQRPNLEAALGKLDSFLGDSTAEAKQAMKRFRDTTTAIFATSSPKASIADTERLLQAGHTVFMALRPAQYFPLLDILKYAILDERIAVQLAETLFSGQNLVHLILSQSSSSSSASELPKATFVTLLRLLCNALSSSILADSLLCTPQSREQLAGLSVRALLETDKTVRTCAGSLVYSIVGWIRKRRHEWTDEDASEKGGYAEQEEFEMELCTAVLEALDREDSAEVAHRLLASLGGLLFLSPHFEDALSGLLQALEAKRIVQNKREILSGNKEALRLVDEVSELCDAA